jgi:bifunctional DNA-binding transcriptional regulator/antitoxin component of YhaV-PrlF toxin-antitoxin module
MTIIPRPTYEDTKTYPILVRCGGYNKIVEMFGIHVNAYNLATQLNINPKPYMENIMIVELETDEHGFCILPIANKMYENLGWKIGDELTWVDNKDGSFTISKVKPETELVLVETITQHLHRYVIEVPKDKTDWALDTVTMGGDLSELGQKYIGETILSHRVITSDEALKLGQESTEWMTEDSMNENHIVKSKDD